MAGDGFCRLRQNHPDRSHKCCRPDLRIWNTWGLVTSLAYVWEDDSVSDVSPLAHTCTPCTQSTTTTSIKKESNNNNQNKDNMNPSSSWRILQKDNNQGDDDGKRLKGMMERLTIIRKQIPINMANGIINWVLILNGITSLTTRTVSGVVNVFK